MLKKNFIINATHFWVLNKSDKEFYFLFDPTKYFKNSCDAKTNIIWLSRLEANVVLYCFFFIKLLGCMFYASEKNNTILFYIRSF